MLVGVAAIVHYAQVWLQFHTDFVSVLIWLLCDFWICRPTLSLLQHWEGSGWSATLLRFCPMCLIWSPTLVQLRPTWRLFTLEDVCPLSWEQLWAACWGRKHRLQLPKKYVKPLVNKWRQWVRTIFLHSRPVESYWHFTEAAIFQLSSTVRSNFVLMGKDSSSAFCFKCSEVEFCFKSDCMTLACYSRLQMHCQNPRMEVEKKTLRLPSLLV